MAVSLIKSGKIKSRYKYSLRKHVDYNRNRTIKTKQKQLYLLKMCFTQQSTVVKKQLGQKPLDQKKFVINTKMWLFRVCCLGIFA